MPYGIHTAFVLLLVVEKSASTHWIEQLNESIATYIWIKILFERGNLIK